MPLDIACVGCGQKYRLPETLAGKQAKCKSCGIAMTIQHPASSPAAPKSARPPLQAFGASPETKKSRPPLQTFGAPSSPKPAINSPSRAVAPPVMEFVVEVDEEDEEDEETVLADFEELPPPSRKTKPVAEGYDGPAPAKRPGRIGKSKSSKASYASFYRRFIAFFLDVFLLSFANRVLGFAIGFAIGMYYGMTVNRPPTQEEMALPILGIVTVNLIVDFLYYPLMIASGWQATIGKRALSIKVCDTDGRPIGFGVALLRELAKVLSLLSVVGFFMPLFTEKKQTLHDKLLGTVVVDA